MSETPVPAQHSTGNDIRRVLRSRTDRVIGGVCGGLGRYLQIDPVLLRIAAVALALSGGLGVVAYLIAWVVIPEEPATEDTGTGEGTFPPDAWQSRSDNRHGVAMVVGAALVAVGVLLLANQLVPWFSAAFVWPIVVVGVGVAVLATARR